MEAITEAMVKDLDIWPYMRKIICVLVNDIRLVYDIFSKHNYISILIRDL